MFKFHPLGCKRTFQGPDCAEFHMPIIVFQRGQNEFQTYSK